MLARFADQDWQVIDAHSRGVDSKSCDKTNCIVLFIVMAQPTLAEHVLSKNTCCLVVNSKLTPVLYSFWCWVQVFSNKPEVST